MTRLACTPYENRDGWKIAIIKFKGTWYMCEYDTEEKVLQKSQMDEKQKLMTYMGWKFEQYVTSGIFALNRFSRMLFGLGTLIWYAQIIT